MGFIAYYSQGSESPASEILRKMKAFLFIGTNHISWVSVIHQAIYTRKTLARPMLKAEVDNVSSGNSRFDSGLPQQRKRAQYRMGPSSKPSMCKWTFTAQGQG